MYQFKTLIFRVVFILEVIFLSQLHFWAHIPFWDNLHFQFVLIFGVILIYKVITMLHIFYILWVLFCLLFFSFLGCIHFCQAQAQLSSLKPQLNLSLTIFQHLLYFQGSRSTHAPAPAGKAQLSPSPSPSWLSLSLFYISFTPPPHQTRFVVGDSKTQFSQASSHSWLSKQSQLVGSQLLTNWQLA